MGKQSCITVCTV